MKTTFLLSVTALSLACAVRSSQAAEPGAFDQVLGEKVNRIAICGYGDGHTSKGIPDERTLRAACDGGRDSFVVEVRGLAVAELAVSMKEALKSARRVDGVGAADLPCIAVVTVVLESGKSFQFVATTTGELRSADTRVMPLNRSWLNELTARFCKLLNCKLLE
jgi:hypothetical protein